MKRSNRLGNRSCKVIGVRICDEMFNLEALIRQQGILLGFGCIHSAQFCKIFCSASYGCFGNALCDDIMDACKSDEREEKDSLFSGVCLSRIAKLQMTIFAYDSMIKAEGTHLHGCGTVERDGGPTDASSDTSHAVESDRANGIPCRCNSMPLMLCSINGRRCGEARNSDI